MKNRSISLLTSICLLTLVVLSVGITSFLAYQQTKVQLEESLGNELLRIVKSVAPLIDADLHDIIFADGSGIIENEEEFELLRQQLIKVKEGNKLISRGSPLYTFRKSVDYEENGDLEFVVMTDQDDQGQFFTGYRYTVQKHQKSALEGTASITGIYRDKHGQWISAAAPIRNSEGTIVGILQADKPVQSFNQAVRKRLTAIFINGVITIAFVAIFALMFYRYLRGMEETVFRQRAKMHAIVDNAAEGIITFDDDAHITSFNKAAQQIFGYRAEEVTAQDVYSLFAKGEDVALEDFLLESGDDGSGTRLGSEVEGLRKDGSSFPMEVILGEVDIEDEPLFVTIVRDLSKRKALEQQLVQAQKLESVGQLAAGIAHEINTPIQFVGDNTRFFNDSFGDLKPLIEGCVELISQSKEGKAGKELIEKCSDALEDADWEYLSEEVPTAIKQTLEGVERVTKIVRAMKEFSHPASEEKQPVDINKLVESTVTISTNEWKYIADLEQEFDHSLGPIPCYPGEFNQVVLNLIVNAAHAIEGNCPEGEKGKISIVTKANRKWAEIRVKDSGGGIPEEIANKIFDPFFTTKEVGKGTGQGLSICRQSIVERHGGELTFESEAGKGTEFIIRLPREAV